MVQQSLVLLVALPPPSSSMARALSERPTFGSSILRVPFRSSSGVGDIGLSRPISGTPTPAGSTPMIEQRAFITACARRRPSSLCSFPIFRKQAIHLTVSSGASACKSYTRCSWSVTLVSNLNLHRFLSDLSALQDKIFSYGMHFRASPDSDLAYVTQDSRLLTTKYLFAQASGENFPSPLVFFFNRYPSMAMGNTSASRSDKSIDIIACTDAVVPRSTCLRKTLFVECARFYTASRCMLGVEGDL